MSEVEISIGGRLITFHKSDSLIAIKRKAAPASEARIRALTTAVADAATAGHLAGFELREIGPKVGWKIGREIGREVASPRDVLDQLRAHDAIAAGTEVFHTSDDRVPFVPTGELYVQFAAGATDAQIHAVLDAEHLAILDARPGNAFVLTTTPASRPAMEVAQRLAAQESVALAEPDLATFARLKATFALPTDELLREQWHLENTGFHRNTHTGFTAGADARVVEAWRHLGALGSLDVVVAVIDDGFDLSHPDLGPDDKVVAPRDFTRNSADPRPDPTTEDWHGTACAGVAVGSANGQMIVGAAPRCRLMPVRWGSSLTDREVERWFDWVREQGAWVVSCSWGAAARKFPLTTRMANAIARCAREGRGGRGTVICFAAGNDNHDVNGGGSLDGFAIHPDVIAVAACTSRDQRSSYSNFGAEIWICAPSSGAGGWGITTSDVSGVASVNGRTVELGYGPGPITHGFGGTSSACPLVAGVCALMLTANSRLTAREVKELLRATARRIGPPGDYDASGHSRYHGYGCVNALDAVRVAQAAQPTPRAGAPAGSNTARAVVAGVVGALVAAALGAGVARAEPVPSQLALLRDMQQWVVTNASSHLGDCPLDARAHELTVWLSATGELLCEPQAVREGTRIRVNLRTRADWVALSTVSVKKGEPRKGSSLVRGGIVDGLEGLRITPFAEGAPPKLVPVNQSYGPFGPFEAVDDVKIALVIEAAGIEVTHRVAVKNPFPINVGVGLTFAPGYGGFELIEGTIQPKRVPRTQDVWVTVHWNAFDWHRVGGRWRHGRYYDGRLDGWYRRVSPLLGVSVTDPLEQVFLGASVGIAGGVSVVAGAIYRREPRRLKGGYAIGDAVEGDAVPVDDVASWTYGIGLSFDAGIAKPIVDLLK